MKTSFSTSMLFALLFFSCCLLQGEAIRCYNCYSLKDLFCNDPFHKNSTATKDYPARNVCVKLKGILEKEACVAEGGNDTVSINSITVSSSSAGNGSDIDSRIGNDSAIAPANGNIISSGGNGSDTDSHGVNDRNIVLANGNINAVGDENANYALRGKVDLHCFTCKSSLDSTCGDPFHPDGVVIQRYSGKSVCYKFKREVYNNIYVERGGMLDSEYLQKYQDGELDDFPLRSRCSHMLCNSAPAPVGVSLLLLPLMGLINAVTK